MSCATDNYRNTFDSIVYSDNPSVLLDRKAYRAVSFSELERDIGHNVLFSSNSIFIGSRVVFIGRPGLFIGNAKRNYSETYPILTTDIGFGDKLRDYIHVFDETPQPIICREADGSNSCSPSATVFEEALAEEGCSPSIRGVPFPYSILPQYVIPNDGDCLGLFFGVIEQAPIEDRFGVRVERAFHVRYARQNEDDPFTTREIIKAAADVAGAAIPRR